METCTFCSSAGGEIVWQDGLCRVVRVGGTEGEAFPGFCRVVWRDHVAEMTDLDPNDRRHAMNVVFAVETALLAQRGRRDWAWVNLVGTLVACVVAAAIGFTIGGLFPR